ncbi:MAG: A/G-specific adenine glycosylase [Gemmatimonadota bacterium]
MTLGAQRNAEFRRRLLAYFDAGARSLPWRQSQDPYAVLVSEFMLQQTRVETVIPYFQRWMDRFPSLQALADASQEEVLKLWQGLGYYSRARNLHQAVREVQGRYGGELPRAPKELRTLPGVGPYTAGALASIAFQEPAAAVDGNVRRVLARIMDVPEPSPRELEGWAVGLVDPERPGDFNQALMELGSRVCTPRMPRCGDCPVAGFCGALAADTVAERPRRKAPKPTPMSREGVAVVVLGGDDAEPRLLFRRRPPSGLLAGMWEFPGVELPRGGGVMDALEGLLMELPIPRGGGGDSPVQMVPGELQVVDHVFSHRKIRYIPVVFWVSTSAPAGELEGDGDGGQPGDLHPGTPPGFRWLSIGHARATLPLPAAQTAILTQAEVWLENGE